MQRVRPRGVLAPALIALGSALMALAVAIFVLTTVGVVGDPSGSSGPGTTTGFGSVLSVASPVSPPTPAAPLTTAPLARLTIPSVEIDAPIVVRGVGADGVMQSPDNAVDVAWYDFSARPGEGSNAVFAGHVDYINVGPAVFWPLKDLTPGDRVEIHYGDGTVLAYGVSAINTFDVATAPIEQIVGPAPVDSLTLITCAGTFDRASGQYDKRLIVRAERV